MKGRETTTRGFLLGGLRGIVLEAAILLVFAAAAYVVALLLSLII